MPVKIEGKIVGYKVKVGKPSNIVPEVVNEKTLEILQEGYERPEKLKGTTYRIKPPTSNASMYITINDLVLNEGTEDESAVPYELFVVSKQMESFQWITAVSLLISAVLKKGGNVSFLVSQLKGVFDPSGGYFLKGKYYNSVVHHIGTVLEKHFKSLGLIESKKTEVAHKEVYIEEPTTPLEEVSDEPVEVKLVEEDLTSEEKAQEKLYKNADYCPVCGQKTLVKQGGCEDCHADGCQYTKCGG